MSVQIVTFQDVCELVNKPDPYYLIDVRGADELEKHGKIKHATVNIPIADLDDSLKLSDNDFQEKFKVPKPDKSTELIFYCMLGGRATRAMQTALDNGFLNSKCYKGSFTDWKENDGEIIH